MPDTMPNKSAQNHSWSCLSIKGPDTRQFLQGQITNDVALVSSDRAILAGLCTPKGRLLANFYLCQLGETETNELIFLIPSSAASIVLTTLSKYIVFSKAEISELQHWAVRSVVIDSAENTLAATPGKQAMSSCSLGSGVMVRIEDNQSRCLLACPNSELSQLEAAITCQNDNEWPLQDIRTGLGFLQEQTSDQFIPQMLNMELTGGISFTKGCYTGQEIVARAKYKGAVKRAMCRLEIKSPILPPAGADLKNEAGEKTVGTVISSARSDDQTTELLAVLNNPDKPAYLDGIAAEKLSLPYLQ